MIGYEVTLSTGEVRQIEADRYAVGDDGALHFFGAESVVERLVPGRWLQVDKIGTRLADTWPPEILPLVTDAVAERLGAHYGCYVHGLRDLTIFEDWRMNDLDEFTAAIFEAVDEDSSSSDVRTWVSDVRDIVLRAFHAGQ